MINGLDAKIEALKLMKKSSGPYPDCIVQRSGIPTPCNSVVNIKFLSGAFGTSMSKTTKIEGND